MKSRIYSLIWFLIPILTIHPLPGPAASVADDPPKPNPTVQPGTLGSDVNPFIGTGGVRYLCGNNFPGATVPFGMVRLSPDTVSPLGNRATNSSGYYYRDQRILGFSHTRLAGTGATDGGNFLVIPCTADAAKLHRRGLNADYSHQQERAFPGYYGLTLPTSGITAELTATRRVGVHRYTFSATPKPTVFSSKSPARSAKATASPAKCAFGRKHGKSKEPCEPSAHFPNGMVDSKSILSLDSIDQFTISRLGPEKRKLPDRRSPTATISG